MALPKGHKVDCQCPWCKRERARQPVPETTEEHLRRLGCFSPGEVEALLKAEASHDKVDQLARNKGVGLPLPAGIDDQAEAIIVEARVPGQTMETASEGVKVVTTADDRPSLATGEGRALSDRQSLLSSLASKDETPTTDPVDTSEAGGKPPSP